MPGQTKFNRRQFFGKTAAAIAAVGFPTIVPSKVLGLNGAIPPSECVVTGIIGTGGRGTSDTRAFLSSGLVQLTAVCDIDAGRRKKALDLLDEKYDMRGVDAYHDFRELLARDDLDAVIVGTPDHWHALISIAAAKAGKDVYCEKPLAHIVEESQEVVRVVRRYGRVLQTGSQERSGRARYACELVRNGYIGELKKIQTNLPVVRHELGPQPIMPVPKGFDYDTWLGPAPWAPYTELRCHSKFRWNLDYSDGELTDRGAHVNDIALWGAEPQIEGRMEIDGWGEFPADGLWNAPNAYEIKHRFDNGLEWLLTDKGSRGIKFMGTEGWIFVHIHGGRMEAEPESLLRVAIKPDDIHLHESPEGHHADFLRCVKTREDPAAHVEAGHRTATFCHIGMIAIRLGRKVTWDWDTETFVNDAEANRMLTRPNRSPWIL